MGSLTFFTGGSARRPFSTLPQGACPRAEASRRALTRAYALGTCLASQHGWVEWGSGGSA
jgi:hypothetical protein